MQTSEREQIFHLIGLAKRNAKWHRDKFRKTHDRYYLGQWKAYWRLARRLFGMDALKQGTAV